MQAVEFFDLMYSLGEPIHIRALDPDTGSPTGPLGLDLFSVMDDNETLSIALDPGTRRAFVQGDAGLEADRHVVVNLDTAEIDEKELPFNETGKLAFDSGTGKLLQVRADSSYPNPADLLLRTLDPATGTVTPGVDVSLPDTSEAFRNWIAFDPVTRRAFVAAQRNPQDPVHLFTVDVDAGSSGMVIDEVVVSAPGPLGLALLPQPVPALGRLGFAVLGLSLLSAGVVAGRLSSCRWPLR